MTPNQFVPIAMIGANVLYLIFFAALPKRRALLISVFLGWLFLPVYTYEFEGMPDYSKTFSICFGIMIAVFVFDWKRIVKFRPRWVDLPMLIWCLVPFASSWANRADLPVNYLYDGFSESLGQTVQWGIPYFLGRLYFTNWKELRELAYAVVISGLVYLPFLIYEMAVSPQLHFNVYGFHQHRFDQTFRFGMWRPMAFMRHGLMVAFWMMTTAITAVWLWYSKAITKISHRWLPFDVPFFLVPIILMIMVVFSVSANAWIWLTAGLIASFATVRLKTRIPLVLMIIGTVTYIGLQSTGRWPTDLTVDFATGLFGPDRAQSLEFRYGNEELLTERARESWLFGWAGWDRQLVKPEWGSPTVPDSLWVIVFGKFGVVGLVSLLLSVFLPTMILIYRYPPWLWGHPNLAPAAAMSIILVLYWFDFLLNAMINPLLMIINGAVLGVLASVAKLQTASKTEPTPSQPDLQPAAGD